MQIDAIESAFSSVADNSIIDRLVREGFIDRLYKKR
jgi:hypothetical protein